MQLTTTARIGGGNGSGYQYSLGNFDRLAWSRGDLVISDKRHHPDMDRVHRLGQLLPLRRWHRGSEKIGLRQPVGRGDGLYRAAVDHPSQCGPIDPDTPLVGIPVAAF